MAGHLNPSTRRHRSPVVSSVCPRRRGSVLAPTARRAQRFDPIDWVGHWIHRCSTKANAAQPERGVFSSDVDNTSVLAIEHIRDQLKAQESPFAETNNSGGGFVKEQDYVALQTIKFESSTSAGFADKQNVDRLRVNKWCLRAGARKEIYFNPPDDTAAIVTCGGLYPGLNDVIQHCVFTLLEYGVREENIFGIMYGLRGFYTGDHKPISLTKQKVEGIHLRGGTILGTSRGGADMKEIVHRIKLWGLDMVFVIGGNGGNAAANAMHMECRAQGVKCCVVGVPKSIDNDIIIIDRCFGFETAVAEAKKALLAGKVDASSAYRGVGLVHVMGRQSGFITMMASMASGVVDVCLIPEIKFTLPKLREHIRNVIARKGHCVICVAEGAGQDLMREAQSGVKTDASGNPVLADIGKYLAGEIKGHFETTAEPVDLKYIDPTYMVRAIPTIPSDHIYCAVLGQNAVHAAFAGYTGLTTGLLNTKHANLPIPAVIEETRVVNINGRNWLKTSISQPNLF